MGLLKKKLLGALKYVEKDMASRFEMYIDMKGVEWKVLLEKQDRRRKNDD